MKKDKTAQSTKELFFTGIGFVQHEIVSGEYEANLKRVGEVLRNSPPAPGTLLILPEMWGTGFDYSLLHDQVETATPYLLNGIKELSFEFDVHLCGSLPARYKEKNSSSFGSDQLQKVYNSSFMVSSGSIKGRYDKNHLFGLWNEQLYLQEGQFADIIETDRGNVAVQICYDLRFPESARYLCRQGADVLVYSAQWPEARKNVWLTLLQARAIENQIYVVGCNGLGLCEESELGGNSVVIDPFGNILNIPDSQEGCVVFTPDLFLQNNVRERFNTVASDKVYSSSISKVIDEDSGVLLLRKRYLTGQKIVVIPYEEGSVTDMKRHLGLRKTFDFAVTVMDESMHNRWVESKERVVLSDMILLSTKSPEEILMLITKEKK